jgi:hypothetical protein
MLIVFCLPHATCVDFTPCARHVNVGFYVENLFLVDCEELDDLLAVLEEGMRNRSVGTHMMNSHSSRSHTILTGILNAF